MRYVSLFSGIEAASVAWSRLGWEPVAFAEVDPFPSAVLAERFPGVPNLGDVTQVDWSAYRGKADVVVGGSPCQSFSIAGLRKGLADPRGNLMLEFLRACEQIEPEWILWENVPGVLSSNGGKDFETLLQAVVELWPRGGFAWRVLDAQFFGVAQRRRRVFLVVNTGDWARAAAVLFESEGVFRDLKPSREKRAELAARSGGGASCTGFAWHCGGDTALGVSEELSPTVTTTAPPACAGFKFHQGSGAGGIGFEEEQSPTLTADWHNPAVLRRGATYDIAGNIVGRKPENGGNGLGSCDPDEDGTYTLTASDRPGMVGIAAPAGGGTPCDPTRSACGGATRRWQGTPRAGGGERDVGDEQRPGDLLHIG